MTVLFRKEDSDFYEWSCGSTRLLTDITENGHPLTISIKCSFGENTGKHYALFDTGARWTVVPESLVEMYPNTFESLDIPVTLNSRHGNNLGMLHRCAIRILVDSGEDLTVEATVLVIPGWNASVVIGYTTLLEHIRWACDPTIDHEGRLYFGKA